VVTAAWRLPYGGDKPLQGCIPAPHSPAAGLRGSRGATAASDLPFGQTNSPRASPPLAGRPQLPRHREGHAGKRPARSHHRQWPVRSPQPRPKRAVTIPVRGPGVDGVQLARGRGRGRITGEKAPRPGEAQTGDCRCPQDPPPAAAMRLDLCHPVSPQPFGQARATLLSGGPARLPAASPKKADSSWPRASPAQPRAATPKANHSEPRWREQGPSSWEHSGHKDRPRPPSSLRQYKKNTTSNEISGVLGRAQRQGPSRQSPDQADSARSSRRWPRSGQDPSTTRVHRASRRQFTPPLGERRAAPSRSGRSRRRDSHHVRTSTAFRPCLRGCR